MADSTGICRECGNQFTFEGKRGMPAKYCGDECRANARAEAQRTARQSVAAICCGWCGNPIKLKPRGSGRRANYCSKRCKQNKSNAVERENRKPPSPITASMRKTCEGCGGVGGKTNRGLCMSCTDSQRSIMRALWQRVFKGSMHLPPRLVAERSERIIVCAECGADHTYIPPFGEPANEKKYCSRKCQKRDSDRTRTRARRAATRSANCESVDYNVVFDRDGWKCGLCGAKTLRSKRGTTHDRAPVLDHIVPLSKGGDHTYKNVQCACNSCNSAKGANLIGQLRLFG